MTGWKSFLRVVALLVAAAGLTANGAQAHVQMRSPDSIDVPMCGNGLNQVVHIAVGDPVPADTSMETCCGDCMEAVALLPPAPAAPVLPGEAIASAPEAAAHLIHPGSPLWPGAPPVGPPASFKA